MAEGDTILRTARRLHDTLAGQEVAVRAPHPRGRAARVESLDGGRVQRVEARGKHLLLRFEAGRVLHSHLGMSGCWDIYEPGSRSRRPKSSAWVALSGDRAVAAQFGGSTLRVIDARRLYLDPILGRLGPDILAEQFTVYEGVSAMRRGDPALALGEALLDQRLIAGVGNVFKSEGCFAAGINPGRPLGGLEDAELARVITAIRKLMPEAVRSGRQPRCVYRRSGRPCPRCGTALRSRGQGDANRATYWCPVCQPALHRVASAGAASSR